MANETTAIDIPYLPEQMLIWLGVTFTIVFFIFIGYGLYKIIDSNF